MWGKQAVTDERGVSEIYGTVLVISVTFMMAVFLVALGYVAIDGLTEETEESLAQDSLDVMDERISEVTGAAVDSTSEFTIPAGAGDVDVDNSDGEIELLVRSEIDASYLESPTSLQTNDEDIRLGSIKFEGQNRMTYWQGGGLWDVEDGAVSLRSAPGLQYDGERLSMSLTEINEDAVIERDSSVSVSQGDNITELGDMISDMQLVNVAGEEYVHQVDAELTISSDLAAGWAEYAIEAMDTPPANADEISEQLDEEGTDLESVTLEFEDVGPGLNFPFSVEEFEKDVEAGPQGNPFDADILYNGSSAYAGLNEVIDETERGFEIDGEKVWDEGYTELDEDGEVWIAQFGILEDGQREADEMLITRHDEPKEWDRHGGGGLKEEDIKLFSGVEEEFRFSSTNPQPICVFVTEGDTSENAIVSQFGDDEEFYDVCFDEDDIDQLSPQYDVTKLTADTLTRDGKVAPEFEITNFGGEQPDYATLKVGEPGEDFDDGEEFGEADDVDYFVVGEDELEFEVEATQNEDEIDLSWDYSESQFDRIKEEFGDEVEIKLETNSHSNSTTVALESPPEPYVEIDDVEPVVVTDKQSALEVETTVNNTGNASDPDRRVQLRFENAGTVVASEVVDIEDGTTETVTFDDGLYFNELDTNDPVDMEVDTGDDTYGFSVNSERFEVEEVNSTYTPDDEELDISTTVTNTGDTPANQSVTLDVDRPDGGTDSETQSIELDPGESEERVFNSIDVSNEPGEYEINVTTPDHHDDETHEIEAANAQLSDVTFDSDATNDDTTITVTGDVTNEGDLIWDEAVEAEIEDGTDDSTGDLNLIQGESEENFELDVTIDAEEVGANDEKEVIVAAGEDDKWDRFKQSALTVENLTVEPDVVVEEDDDSFEVIVDIVNEGELTTQKDVSLNFDGSGDLSTEPVTETIVANGQETVEYDISPDWIDDSGTYDVVFTGLEDGDTGESVEIIATPAPQFEEEEEEECSFWFIGCESDYTVEWDIDDPSGTFEEIEFKFEGETEYTSEELSGEETIVEEEEESSGTVTATIYHEYGELTIED